MFPSFVLYGLALTELAAYVSALSEYGQCGGKDWTGGTACPSGWVCAALNPHYSQCIRGRVSSSSSVAVPTSSRLATTTSTSSAIPTSAPTIGPSHQVGKLPALGWNSWNAYGCDINEDKILAAANQFVTLRLDKAGYEYINIDDCWSVKTRDPSTGRIVPDPDRFPNGIQAIADQVHALGLKLGIYSDAGNATCAGYPGSLGNEDLDATTFAEWGVDYLKYDNCNDPGNYSDPTPPDGDWYNSGTAIRYRRMTAALDATDRQFHLNICNWGLSYVWEWGARVGHSWRMSADSSPTWSYILEILQINVQHLSSIDFFAHNDIPLHMLSPRPTGRCTTEHSEHIF